VVEGDVALGEETIPFCEGEIGVAGGEAGDEVVLPCLDGSFGCVATVAVGWDTLE
jgi:hypothetical protein